MFHTATTATAALCGNNEITLSQQMSIVSFHSPATVNQLLMYIQSDTGEGC